MIFKVYRASGKSSPDAVEIRTIEDLQRFASETGDSDLIVSFGDEDTITIYDDWLE